MMEPEGNTDCLLSEHPEDAMEEFKQVVENSVRFFKSVWSQKDAKYVRTGKVKCKNVPPVDKISLASTVNQCDTSTIGSDDPMCLNSQGAGDCDSCSDSASNVDQVFRDLHSATMPKISKVTTTAISGARNSYDEETTLYLCEDISESFSYDENEDHYDMVRATTQKTSSVDALACFHDSDGLERQLLLSIKINSVIIGLLLGLFIQFSTLGANFMVSSYLANFQSESEPDSIDNEFKVLAFNMMWSFFASFLGVLFMLMMRCLFAKIYQGSSMDIRNTHLLHMECFLSAGALVGVSLAWIGTDGFLDINAHLLLSALTLAGALVWCKVLSYLLQSRQKMTDESDSEMESMLKNPLLPKGKRVEKTKPKRMTSLAKIKAIGSILGLMIGLFIQFSSLGINFLLQAVYRDLESSSDLPNARDPLMLSSGTHEEVKRIIIRISFLWSFITSFIGIVLLIVIRCMVTNVFSTFNAERSLASPALTLYQDKIILNLECFFALGATVGLNLSWTFTDYLLGLDSHILQSILTLGLTIFWCKIVMYFLGPKQSNKTENMKVTTFGKSKPVEIIVV